jgi:hypothetical protein
VPAMSEDHIGREDFLEFLEAFFDRRTEVGKESISKGFYNDRFISSIFQEGIRAAPGFFGSRRIGTKDKPVKFDALRLPNHLEQGATTSDLDIVAVRPQAQHALHAIQIARNHFLISC